MFGKLHFLHPDPEPDRSFFHFFRTDLIGCGLYAPERGGKYQIPGSYQVLEVPEVIDTLRKEPDFARVIFELRRIPLS